MLNNASQRDSDRRAAPIDLSAGRSPRDWKTSSARTSRASSYARQFPVCGTGVAATAEQAQETRGVTASHGIPATLLLFVPSQTRASATGSRKYVDEKTAHEIRIRRASANAENAPELSNYPDIVRHSASV